jgi:hypothetical protein
LKPDSAKGLFVVKDQVVAGMFACQQSEQKELAAAGT